MEKLRLTLVILCIEKECDTPILEAIWFCDGRDSIVEALVSKGNPWADYVRDPRVMAAFRQQSVVKNAVDYARRNIDPRIYDAHRRRVERDRNSHS